jgi:O-antigen/teichoic acid export membrane protein
MTLDNKAAKRDRNILNGVITGVGGRGVSLLAPFLVMPAMLKHLGEENFGIWMTLVSITSMAMFMDFGIGNGLLTKLSKAYGDDDLLGMRRLIATGYTTLTIISLTAAALLAFGLGWVAKLEQENVLHMTDAVAVQIAFVTGITFLIGIPISVIQRVMLSCQQNVQSNAWQLVSGFVTVAACYYVIHLNLTSAAAVAAYAISPILVMLVATAYFFVRKPELLPRRIDLSMSHAKELISLGSYFFILSIITSIALNSDNVIIAFVLGPEAVTAYAIPAKLASILGLLVTTLFLPLWAANGEAIARKDYVWIEQTNRRMSLIGGLLVGSMGLLLALFSEKILDIWMGRSFAHEAEIILGFTLTYTLFAIASSSQMILNAASMLRVQVIAWAVFLVISIVVKYGLVTMLHTSWMIPFVSAVTFFIFILPIMLIEAKKVYANF